MKRKLSIPETSSRKRRRVDIDWNAYVSATATRNYLLNDPLLDWLKMHHNTFIRQKPVYTENINKAIIQKSGETFTEFIMSQGIEFEKLVMKYLYENFGDYITDIGGDGNTARSLDKAQETLDEMKRGTPIIYSGVLHDHKNRTYGVPDLLIRSDWFSKLLKKNPILEADETIPAPNISDSYHYRVVDIKHTSLSLCADGFGLLNVGSIPAYKGQLWIYTRALGELQGYEPPSAYILGKRWSYWSKGAYFKGDFCLDRLGVVDFVSRDISVITKTNSAVKWIRDCRENGSKWDIKTIPFEREELYPNMCNQSDFPWHNVKKQLAEEIDEITSVWQCGVKNREAAHAVNVFRWSDPKCNADILGITGQKTKPVLNSILDINRSKTDIIRPLTISDNTEDWQTRQAVEFFVDFEFTNLGGVSLRSENIQTIFMIGVGFYDNDHSWNYQDFTVSHISNEEEKRICKDFSNYIIEISERYECVNPLLIHWSHAEETQWSGVHTRHKEMESIWESTGARWFDLLKVFKSEPITIKGALNFGLKSVANAFYNQGLINVTWEQGMDGTMAMLTAYKCDIEATNRGVEMGDLPQIEDIKTYNEIDCRSMGEILTYLRKNHLKTENV